MNRVLEDERRRGPFSVGEETRPVTEEVGAAAPVPEPVRPGEAALPAEGPDATTDTLALTITVVDPGSLPGVYICLGATERSTGLWRVGIENRELTDGVRCVGADFDLYPASAPESSLLGGRR